MSELADRCAFEVWWARETYGKEMDDEDRIKAIAKIAWVNGAKTNKVMTKDLDEKLTQCHVDYLLSQGKVKKLKSFIEKASFDESQGQYYFDMPNSTNVIWTDSLIDLYNKVKEEDGKLKVRDESYWLPEKDGRDS